MGKYKASNNKTPNNQPLAKETSQQFRVTALTGHFGYSSRYLRLASCVFLSTVSINLTMERYKQGGLEAVKQFNAAYYLCIFTALVNWFQLYWAIKSKGQCVLVPVKESQGQATVKPVTIKRTENQQDKLEKNPKSRVSYPVADNASRAALSKATGNKNKRYDTKKRKGDRECMPCKRIAGFFGDYMQRFSKTRQGGPDTVKRL